MGVRSVSDLSNGALWSAADKLEARERASMAQLLACIAEIGARKLWAEEGYASLHACCMERWHMSEDMASKRIIVAKAGKRFPTIFQGLADGRFHLSGLVLVAPKLVESNADELLAEVANKSKREIEYLIANRFPQDDVPTMLVPVAVSTSVAAVAAPADLTSSAPGRITTSSSEAPMALSLCATPSNECETLAPQPVAEATNNGSVSLPAVVAPTYPRVTPRAPERYALQLTMDQETHDLLREAQALMNLPAQSEIPELLKRALKHYVARLKQRKFGTTSRPQKKRAKTSKNPRQIPAAVRRAVDQRDGRRCTYESDSGRRCTATTDLEYDHVLPVARDGESTIDNLRLRCRAHNQLEAERMFGAAFMEARREANRAVAPPS